MADPIPFELGQLTGLKHLDLSENQLTDPIPPQLANLKILKLLDLSSNLLTGDSLTGLVRLFFFTLDIRENPITDCLPLTYESTRTKVISDLGDETFCED